MEVAAHQKPAKVKLTFVQELAAKLTAGSIAGVVGVTSCYPLDFAKTQLHKQDPKNPKFSGMIDCITKTRAKYGIGGLYYGLRPNLTGIIPEKGLKLAVFDLVRAHLRGSDGRITLANEMVAAVSAAVAQVIVTTPMEIVKIRCQLSGNSAVSVMKDLGVRGMYRGYLSTLTRDVWFNLIFFPMQVHLKAHLLTPQDTRMDKLRKSFIAGITAGVLASALSTPFDVVKTRLQAGDGGGMVGVASNLLKHEGPSAFFLGVQPRIAAIAPLFGIAICTYDLMKRFLDDLGYEVPE